MIGNKVYMLEPLIVGNRKIYPIVKLDILVVDGISLNIKYKVISLKIIENKDVYYKDISESNISKKR
ncbi:MAG: hypothetical protein ACI4VJ_06760 [Methanosphaera sp.]